MSERGGGGGGGFGAFLLGVAVGAVVAFLFAPDTGDVTRAKLQKKLRGLKDLAEEKAGDLVEAVAGDEEEAAARVSPREELERRLADARRRRRTGSGKAGRAAVEAVEEEDEPVA